MPLAPLALFVFNRPEHTKRTIDALLANPEITETPVFVFADGPRTHGETSLVARTRAVVRESGFRNLTVLERDQNFGLARSIIHGVGDLCERFGRVIVLEDDLVVSHSFLRFMNAALERYAEDNRVYHVSGYMFPVDALTNDEVVFLPFVNPWGWGTWKRAWGRFDPSARAFGHLKAHRALRRRFDFGGSFFFYRMLEAQQAGRVDSWFIRWNLSVFVSRGMAVYPAISLVQNTGFGVGATHTAAPDFRFMLATAHEHFPKRFQEPAFDKAALSRIRRFLWWDTSRTLTRVRRLARAVVRFFRGAP